jgi:GNAT superfamily N-acetyltransferase
LSAASGSIALGETYVTDGCEGAVLWTPPGRPHAVPFVQRLWLMSRFAGPVGALRLMRPLALLDEKTPHVEHFYLRVLGVEPSMQRQGLGSRLMQPVLARCDEQRIPAYLFSTKQQNVTLYERHGFHVIEEVWVPRAPTVWTMWREPRA